MDALRRGYLLSLQISIYEREDSPTSILEQWVIAFSYVQDPHTGTRVPIGVEVREGRRSNSKSTITVSKARQSLVHFIQQVVNVSYVLPDLPASRYFTLEAFYTKECPDDYNAPGFTSPGLQTSDVLSKDDWKRISVASMNAGHHGVALSVGYALDQPSHADQQSPEGLPCEHPGESNKTRQAATARPLEYTASRPRRNTAEAKTQYLSSSSAVNGPTHDNKLPTNPVQDDFQRPQKPKTESYSKSDRMTKEQLSNMVRLVRSTVCQ
jgi:hypothetical protein